MPGKQRPEEQAREQRRQEKQGLSSQVGGRQGGETAAPKEAGVVQPGGGKTKGGTVAPGKAGADQPEGGTEKGAGGGSRGTRKSRGPPARGRPSQEEEGQGRHESLMGVALWPSDMHRIFACV